MGSSDHRDRASAGYRGSTYGIAAAALFGISTPLAKLLVPGSSPVALAALLYLGAAAALAVAGIARRGFRGAPLEAALRRADLPLLIAVIACGGVAGPVLMLVGLSRVPAVTAALLLNLEAPFTIAIAVFALGEHLGGREWLAAALVIAGAALLSGGIAGLGAPAGGTLAIAGACLFWGIDNNLTQRLSVRDPIAIVRAKALGAGVANLAIALLTGARFPARPSACAAAVLVGAASYGVSIVLDTHALRLIGAAREAACFATAPLFGVAAAVLLLGDTLGAREIAAAIVIGVGLALLVRARHEHEHEHQTLTHDHVHVHDVHHQHPHRDGTGREPHAHPHTHTPLHHTHPHVSDAHHRHRH
jgi:drug/metabolite transporter (DMT)-like permease